MKQKAFLSKKGIHYTQFVGGTKLYQTLSALFNVRVFFLVLTVHFVSTGLVRKQSKILKTNAKSKA